MGALAPLNVEVPELYTFRDGELRIFPLASEVVRQARLWVQAEGTFPKTARATRRPRLARRSPQKAKQRRQNKRPTVFQTLAGPNPVLQRPLASVLPPYQPVPKSLAEALGAPPPAKAQPPATATQVNHDAEMARAIGIGDGELPGEGPSQSSSLAGAVLAQSQALMALVSQMSQGVADPLLETQPGASTSVRVRGSVGRAKLQQELFSRSGSGPAKYAAWTQRV